MGQIQKLDELIINQIAAGEVIENPSSVVKELLDNAFDSGAKTIVIKALQGGKELIVIEDDGAGMDKEDLALSIERHATSKLESKNDLFSINTLGFRGEALASIASIANLEIVTAKNSLAYKLSCKGGEVSQIEAAKRCRGTTVRVKELFFNTPVRKKFQKSTNYLTKELIKVVQLFALAHPNLHISLNLEEKSYIYLPAKKRKHRISEVLGKAFVKDSMEVNYSKGPIQIEGVISSPSNYKTHRKSQCVFINDRPVFSPYISAAVREGYKTFIPENTFPIFALFLTLPSHGVDVNVHPQKKEVRLLDERGLFLLVKEMVFETLNAPVVSLFTSQNTKEQAFIETPEKVAKSFSPSKPFSLDLSPKITLEKQAETAYNAYQNSFSFEKEKEFTICYKRGHLMLVQEEELFSTREESRLVLIDLQAAFAKLLTLNQKDKTTVSSQKLCTAVVITLLPDELSQIIEHEELLKEMGIEVRAMGEDTIAIDKLPSYISFEKAEEFFKALLKDLFSKGTITKERATLKVRLCMQIARRRKVFSDQMARKMIHTLIEKNELTMDPKGRKIITFIDEKQLESFLK